MDNVEKAFEELKIFQKIIHTHDAIFDRIRNWCITLVSAISVGYLSDSITISIFQYVFIATLIVIFFAWSEAIHRVAQTRALKRSSDIEMAIRGDTDYIGPQIRNSLQQGNKLSDQIKVIRRPRFYITYVSMIFIILILGFGGW